MALTRTRRPVVTVCNRLEKRYGKPARRSGPREPLDELLIILLAEDSSQRAATRAYARLQMGFVDWNEVRVSTREEIAQAIEGVSDALNKAVRLKTVLGRIYATRHEMSLDFLKEVGAPRAQHYLARLEGLGDYAAARVMLEALGLPAMPVNAGIERVIKRLGWAAAEAQPLEVREILESIVPADRMFDAYSLLNEHSRKTCIISDPKCPRCPIRSHCRMGRAMPRTQAPARSSSRGKKEEK